jgi:hypothetical protein
MFMPNDIWKKFAFTKKKDLDFYTTGKPGIKPHRRLKKPVRRIIAGLTVVLFLIISFPILKHLFDGQGKNNSGNSRVDNFRDINYVHLRFAKANGISPLLSGKVFQEKQDELIRKKSLVRVSDSKYYVLNKLSHSHPYLVPKAKKLLDLIGERFQKKLNDHNKKAYLFRVTSLLRTQESQKRLSHSNGNATSQSAHLYGTTFDITYKSLAKKTFFGGKKTIYEGEAIRLLSETIGELQKERKLVVVTERHEACFHITVR